MALYRFAIATQGTRGDFQPVLALGLGLAKAGHKVKFFANPGHCKMAEEFDFEAAAISFDAKDFLQTPKGMKAMETGDLALLGSHEFADDDVQRNDVDYVKIFLDECTAFHPDVLIWTPLVGYQVFRFKDASPNTPTVMAAYQPHCIPTNHIGPILMQRLEVDPDMPTFYRWVLEAQADAKSAFERGVQALSEGLEPSLADTPQFSYERYFNIEEQASPILLAYSPSWWPSYDDWPTVNVEITGNWKISKNEQEVAARKGGQLFNAGGQLQACVDFINAGEPPVYIGWGSMMVYSKEHMARLAVGALKEANRRGIIVGGWAELSEESLGDGDEYAELKAYCSKNILFLKAAPHEWLFPQCACCIHHGGIGTTQASLSAGVPTIVTPVFADQKDIAVKLTTERHGASTAHLSKVTAKELGECIRKCCTDQEIIQNCRILAEKMQQEDGVTHTVGFLEKFMTTQVQSGKWKRTNDAQLARLRASAEKLMKVKVEQVFGMWHMDLMAKYPIIKDYLDKQMIAHTRMLALLKDKKLWYVRAASGCLAREGEGLKTSECGRFKEFAMLEELASKGSRIRVKRIRGIGPDEGWVTPVVSGKDIIVRVENPAEITRIQADSIQKQFSDMAPKEVKTHSLLPV
jgi:sterol 3beta-glucosyltransferase